MAQVTATEPEQASAPDTAHEAAFQAMRSAYLLLSERFEKELADAGLPDLGFYGVLLALSEAPVSEVQPKELRELLSEWSARLAQEPGT